MRIPLNPTNPSKNNPNPNNKQPNKYINKTQAPKSTTNLKPAKAR